MTLETTILLDGLRFPEGLRWHEGRLWFSDFQLHQVMTVDMAGRAETIVEVPGQPSGLGWLPDGRLLVVSMSDRRLLRLDPEGLVEVADLSGLASQDPNDMVVDGQGRAYVGHVGFSLHVEYPRYAPAEIILVTPEGEARIVAEDMAFPNGTVITPDGLTLIVAESWGGLLTAFDIEADGSLSRRRVWAELDDIPLPDGSLDINSYAASLDGKLLPDGICLDAEGAIWVASPTSFEVVRVREGGEVLQRVRTSLSPKACMLGGVGRRTLFAGSSTGGPESVGRIEMVEVAVPGAGLP